MIRLGYALGVVTIFLALSGGLNAVMQGSRAVKKPKIGSSVQDIRKARFQKNRLQKSGPLGIIRQGGRVFVPAEIVSRETSTAAVFFSKLRIAPHRDLRGRMSGFRLLRLDRGSFVDSLGFREGDVIQRINHKKLDSMSSIFKIFTRLKKSKKTRIKVAFLRKNKVVKWEVIKRNKKTASG